LRRNHDEAKELAFARETCRCVPDKPTLARWNGHERFGRTDVRKYIVEKEKVRPQKKLDVSEKLIAAFPMDGCRAV
jgi:hypothetical protein